MKSQKAFTLIELLIVVAIIAILAAIAVPNFLEAQVRAKVSRVKSDMRTVATALESYQVDYNAYPYDGYRTSGSNAPAFNYWYLSRMLSTPTAYITTVNFPDPFRQNIPTTETGWQVNNLRYTSTRATWGTQFGTLTGRGTTPSPLLNDTLSEFGGWRLNGAGPDRVYGPSGWQGVSAYPTSALPLPYDPTNGTVSDGDIIRTQISSTGYVNTK
jgi:prepilin-type N-terminal cleavage/methylation domain-containing protein